MKDINLKQLVVPALKARMGDWNYYIGFLRFRDIVDRVSIAEEIHVADSLKELLQRGLKNRAPDIASYLKSQSQRFFNSLVVGTYGGSPKWYEVDIKPSNRINVELPSYIEGALGLLVLNGDETIFAIDGQHRVAGIREAIKNKDKLGDEEIAVIFLKGVSASVREKDPEGFERTRRLFTTLNSRAKSVSKRDIIALDEDDVIAILTRNMIESYPLFKGKKIRSKGVKSIPRNDATSLITIVGLYDALDALLVNEVNSLELQKRKRPDDKKIDEFYRKACDWYSHLINSFQPLKEFLDSKPEDKIAKKYRGEKGGHLLFRPIGFVMIHKVGAWLSDTGCSLNDATVRLSKIPMDIAEPPWINLLWDDVSKRMLYTAECQKVAEKIMFYCAGGNLIQVKTSLDSLKKELSGLIKKSKTSIKLTRYSQEISSY